MLVPKLGKDAVRLRCCTSFRGPSGETSELLGGSQEGPPPVSRSQPRARWWLFNVSGFPGAFTENSSVKSAPAGPQVTCHHFVQEINVSFSLLLTRVSPL